MFMHLVCESDGQPPRRHKLSPLSQIRATMHEVAPTQCAHAGRARTRAVPP